VASATVVDSNHGIAGLRRTSPDLAELYLTSPDGLRRAASLAKLSFLVFESAQPLTTAP